MKKVLITLWAVLPFMAMAEFPVYTQAIQTTQQLQFSLNSLSQQAGYEAQTSFDFYAAQTLRDVSYRSAQLSNRVGNDVLYALNTGAPLYQASDAIQRLQFDFDQLGQLITQVIPLSFQMQSAVNGVRQSHVQLKQLLMVGPGPGPGPFPLPVSASCAVEVGLLGRSSVSCNLNGLGLTGFTVTVNGMPVWSGVLYPQVGSQRFDTDRRPVGGFASRYAVYVNTSFGQQLMVYSR